MPVKLSSLAAGKSPNRWGIVSGLGRVEPMHTMTRFSQPSFLRGVPQPLVLSIQSRGEHPFELYEKIASPSQPSFLLDSGKGQTSDPSYSFLGSGPASVVSIPAQPVGTGEDPFTALRQAVANPGIEPAPDVPPFFGGAVGYFSYDFARRLESLPSLAEDDLTLPDMQFGLYDLVTAVDHRANRLRIIFCPSMERFLGEPREKLYREGLDRLAECEARLKAPPSKQGPLMAEPLSFSPEQTKEAYFDRVRRTQAYIAAGDIYQANLSHRFVVDIPSQHRSAVERLSYEHALYRQLRVINPSPFSGRLRFENLSLISCSPERLVRLRGRHADTRPIAGTRPRGSDAEDDHRLVGELLASPKERAEHVMLVDLERNDLGRVCDFGSMRVDEFMSVEQYSHVSHIVSNVRGVLRMDATPFDLIRAAFPGGTITGVPKIRCMEIIEELEPVRRGPYTGSFGYIGWNGDLDLNIVIRTLVLTGRKAYLQVGAGIVADSDPAKEYEETLHKAQAFFSSLQRT